MDFKRGGVFRSRAGWLWSATILTISFWIFGRDFLNVNSGLIDVLDRKWMAFKQSQERNIRQQSLRPSKKVALLQLQYSSRVDFWFDDKGKAELAKALQNYQGPIIWNIDPLLMMRDKFLSPLLTNKRIVRPVRIEYSGSPQSDSRFVSGEVEALAAQPIEQSVEANLSTEDCLKNGDVSRCIHDLVGVLPNSEDYFKSGAPWGFLAIGRTKIGLGQDETADMSLISELPLRLTGSKLELPNVLLGAVALKADCETYRLNRQDELLLSNCKGGSDQKIQLQDPLPLFFYNRSYGKWPYWQVDLKNLPENRVLVVDLIDSAAVQENFLGEKYTWGALMATALSNIIEDHTPKTSRVFGWVERALFVLALAGILLLYRRENLRWYLEVLIGILLLVAALDFSATVFLNYQTKPVGEFMSLALAGFVGLGILSWREAERRSLIERALSGYVSPQRLQSLIAGDEKLSLAGIRKELTTLQLDIRGFSLLMKEMEVEEVFPFVKEFFSAIDPIIFENGGVIDKKLGDGMFAFFGDRENQTPEAAAKAAVKAAMDVQQKLAVLSEGLFGSASKISARIGVNTGQMMVGNSGSEKHFNYTVLGEAVNFTARLEAACPSGSVLLGEETAKYVRSQWKLVPTQIQVKHEENSVTAYLVLEALR